MGAIGISPTIISQIIPVSQTQDSVPAVLPTVSAPSVLPTEENTGQDLYNIQVAEQKRLQAAQQTAHDIANTHVLGDTTFSLFKDGTGQLITRFTDKTTGKVTYIPEPTLYTLGSSTEPMPTLKLQA